MKFDVGKWYIEVCHGWRIVAINLHVNDWFWGYSCAWYDGPHKSLGIGPINLYWNW